MVKENFIPIINKAKQKLRKCFGVDYECISFDNQSPSEENKKRQIYKICKPREPLNDNGKQK
jgi:hypothetical protein